MTWNLEQNQFNTNILRKCSACANKSIPQVTCFRVHFHFVSFRKTLDKESECGDGKCAEKRHHLYHRHWDWDWFRMVELNVVCVCVCVWWLLYNFSFEQIDCHINDCHLRFVRLYANQDWKLSLCHCCYSCWCLSNRITIFPIVDS